jgi:hypothetical protein
MAGWVKWEKDLETDPRFTRAVRKVRELLRDASVTTVTHERDAGVPERDTCVPVTLSDRIVPIVTMGCLLKLWSYADTHIRSDDTLDLGLADIDELVCLPGFAGALPEDWLVEIDDGHVELPGYQAHNGVEAKKRDLNAKRQERKRSRLQRDGSVTPVTQQRDASVMGALPDQTRPDQTKTRPESRARASARASPSAPPTPTASTGERKVSGAKTRAASATRLPADFTLTDERRLVAEAETLPAERTFAKFCDYWRAASGAKARKLDWDATWRNWCRNDADRNGPGKPNGNSQYLTKFDRVHAQSEADMRYDNDGKPLDEDGNVIPF